MRNTWTVPATVVRVIDGDTIVLDLDLGWRITRRESCRIKDVNSPELTTHEGRRAKDWAEQRLPVGLGVKFVSWELDKYGRPLGEIVLPNATLYSDHLLESGNAVPYKC